MYEELKDVLIEPPAAGYPGTSPYPARMVPLNTLYKDGWWITEIFGSMAVLAHRTYDSTRRYPRFRVVFKLIDTTTISKKAMRKITRVQKDQWEKYKHSLLTGKDKRYKVKRNGKV